ncbi:MAG: glycosyltransferase family 39 protein [Patescibacteria group bacterium]|mgnify:FL=1
MNRFISRYYLLILILIFATFLRFWLLGQVPAGLHEDEAAYGYNAYSLLLTGNDEHGKSFPIVLESFGEYKPALYAYLTIPWIVVFDLTPFAVRATSALFGVFSIIMVYLLAKKLLQNTTIALIAAGMIALSPWHLTLSRTTSEVVVSVFFLLVFVYAALSLKDTFNKWWLITAVLTGILAVESYTAARFFVVALAALVFVFSFKKTQKKILINWTLFSLCLFFIVMGLIISTLDSATRFNQISIVSTPETKLVLEEQIREDDQTEPLITRFFHNKVLNYSRTFIENYEDYFTIDYLFLNGGSPVRVDIPQSGLLYSWQFPFLLLGIYVIVRQRISCGYFLFSWWLLLLFPAAFTFHEIPNIYRSLIVLPALLMILSLGMYHCGKYVLEKKGHLFSIASILLLLFVISLEFISFQHQYYIHQEKHQPWYRGYAFKELTIALQELSPKYKKMIITKGIGGAYISLLFYRKYDPLTYQQEGSPGYDGFDTYTFVPIDCSLNAGEKGEGKVKGEKGVLYVDRGDCILAKKDVKVLKTIYWQDGNPAVRLLEYIPSKAVLPPFRDI